MATNPDNIASEMPPQARSSCWESYSCLLWVVLAVLDIATLLFFPAIFPFDMSFGGTVVYPMVRWYANHRDLYDILILTLGLALLPLIFAATYTSPYEIQNRWKSTIFGFGFGVAAVVVSLPCIGCVLFYSLGFGTWPGRITDEIESLDWNNHRYHLVRFVDAVEYGLFEEPARGGGEYFYLCQCGNPSWRCTCDRIPNLSDSTRLFIRAEEIQNPALFINPASNQLEVHLEDYHYAVESCDAAPPDITSCHAMYFRLLPTPN